MYKMDNSDYAIYIIVSKNYFYIGSSTRKLNLHKFKLTKKNLINDQNKDLYINEECCIALIEYFSCSNSNILESRKNNIIRQLIV